MFSCWLIPFFRLLQILYYFNVIEGKNRWKNSNPNSSLQVEQHHQCYKLVQSSGLMVYSILKIMVQLQIRGLTRCPSYIIFILMPNTFLCSNEGLFTLEFSHCSLAPFSCVDTNTRAGQNTQHSAIHSKFWRSIYCWIKPVKTGSVASETYFLTICFIWYCSLLLISF